LADKVHNARWIVRALLDFFSARQRGPLVEDLRHALSELEELAAREATEVPPHAAPRPVRIEAPIL
jgi:hypothetical protein